MQKACSERSSLFTGLESEENSQLKWKSAPNPNLTKVNTHQSSFAPPEICVLHTSSRDKQNLRGRLWPEWWKKLRYSRNDLKKMSKEKAGGWPDVQTTLPKTRTSVIFFCSGEGYLIVCRGIKLEKRDYITNPNNAFGMRKFPLNYLHIWRLMLGPISVKAKALGDILRHHMQPCTP